MIDDHGLPDGAQGEGLTSRRNRWQEPVEVGGDQDHDYLIGRFFQGLEQGGCRAWAEIVGALEDEDAVLPVGWAQVGVPLYFSHLVYGDERLRPLPRVFPEGYHQHVGVEALVDEAALVAGIARLGFGLAEEVFLLVCGAVERPRKIHRQGHLADLRRAC